MGTILPDKVSGEYLRLPEGNPVPLSDIKSPYLLVQFFNTRCENCIRGMQILRTYFKRMQRDPVMRDKLRMVGLGVYDDRQAVRQFKREQRVPFPLFLDKSGDWFHKTGEESLPVSYLLRRDSKGTYRIVLLKTDFSGGANRFYRDLRYTVHE